MNPTANKRRGAQAEIVARDWLRAHGFPNCERLHLGGARDRGDLTGIPGLVVEVKADSGMTPGQMLSELEVEVANQAAFNPQAAWTPDGLVIIRRKGVPDVARWGALMPLSQAMSWWST